MSEHHLAQINVGHLVAPLDSPEMAEFVDNLAPVNALAEASPGFVWRHTSPGRNDATQTRGREEGEFVNLSVWESIEVLREFAYRSGHLDFLRRRRQWFRPHGRPHQVLWWIPAGHIPTVDEAIGRLLLLEREGPTPHAFTFRAPYAPGRRPES